MSAAQFNVIEFGDDSSQWLAVGQHDLHRVGPSVAEARVAVIETLRTQLLPGNEDAFATAVSTLLDLRARTIYSPIHEAADTEQVCYRSPVGSMPPLGRRIGTCAVAFGVDLPSDRDLVRIATPKEDR